MEDGAESGLNVAGTGVRARVAGFDNFGAIVGSRGGVAVGVGLLCLLVLGAASRVRWNAVQKPFTVCASEGDASGVEHYLALGANPAVPGPEGRTALGEAVMFKHPDVVRVLLAYGANPNEVIWCVSAPYGDPNDSVQLTLKERSAIEVAKSNGDEETIQLLRQAGAPG